jgi:hypothetical protein
VIRRRIPKLVVMLCATFTLAGSAVAYWSYAGAGSATGAGSSGPSALTVTAGTPTQSLLPTGAPTGDVSVTVANPNPYSVRVAQLSLDTAAGSGGFSANAAGCALSFATQDNGGAGWTFPSGATDLVLTNSMTMETGAASSCQGRTFTVYVKAS